MKVGDVMTRSVISLGRRLDAESRARDDPIWGERLWQACRIITQGDFLRRAEIGTEQPWMASLRPSIGQLAEAYVHAHGRKIGEVMTRNVLTVAEDAPLAEATGLMESNRVKRLPVVKGDAVIGIINRVNVLHAFIVSSREPHKALATDADIRQGLGATIDAEPWAAAESLDILVEHGRVDFRGIISDERQRLALRVAAENAHGVRAVSDHLEVSHAPAA